MNLRIELYQTQQSLWPNSGRHIMAQFDDNSIFVYQAYRPAIGRFAARRGYFGGEFSLSRMSWIKPNFLWMMYRCGWASKPGQEVVLAIRLKRVFFDMLLEEAIYSSYVEAIYDNELAWKQAIELSNVRLQWDPDHDPTGERVERRAIQLGMRDAVLAQYARDAIIEIEDISTFVCEQYQHVQAQNQSILMMPYETAYPVADPVVASRLGIGKF